MYNSQMWTGQLKFECTSDCKCQEKVVWTYDDEIVINSNPNVDTVVSVSGETCTVTNNITAHFTLNKSVECKVCGLVSTGLVQCTLSYKEPITSEIRVMVVIMDGDEHQVVSLPLVYED